MLTYLGAYQEIREWKKDIIHTAPDTVTNNANLIVKIIETSGRDQLWGPAPISEMVTM